MIDPNKSLLIDAEKYWTNMNVGDEVGTRDLYRAITLDRSFDTHKLNSLGAFLNNKIKYKMSKIVDDTKSDPKFRKISTESSRAKNKRFCDVINSAFQIEEKIDPAELSLRYKNMNPKDSITKNYMSKLLFSLESHKYLIKLKRGVYAKVKNVSEHEMAYVTRFVKKEQVAKSRKIPDKLKAPVEMTMVEVSKINAYLKEIMVLRNIIAAQRNDIEEAEKILKNIPTTILPDLETEGYADLKEKYNIT